MAALPRAAAVSGGNVHDRFGSISIGRVYYVHGLVCARYPVSVIIAVAVTVIVCSLPFFITTTGDVNSPKTWQSSWINYRLDGGGGGGGVGPSGDSDGEWILKDSSLMSLRTPKWFIGLPPAIVYQIYIHIETNCHRLPSLCDVSYYKLSKTITALLLESLQGTQLTCGSVLHPIVPQFARFLGNRDVPLFPSQFLSPLLDNVQHDANISDQLRQKMSLQTIKELLYGGFWEESHIIQKRTNYSHRFAITFLFQPSLDNFHQLIDCINTINKLWPDTSHAHHMLSKHFYYESDWTIRDFAPLICLYSIVFLYITFSVGKIDLVRSKLGLGFSAVITVICSLTMSLGICTLFGLSITISGSEIFPFVVVVIGLENILIITKAVISTDPGQDVKHRIAEGLSKEGKSLLSNLVTILVLVVLGVFTFNYTMQEFCIIALVGLLCDYFLQLTFFITVISIDLRRMELDDLKFNHQRSQPTPTIAPVGWKRVSRRDKVNNFLVKGRYAQKFMMVVLLAYLASVLSQTELFHSFVRSMTNGGTPPTPSPHPQSSPHADHTHTNTPQAHGMPSLVTNLSHYVSGWVDGSLRDSALLYRSNEQGFNMGCSDEAYCWRPLVTTHWPRLLKYFNISINNKFISVISPLMINYRLGFTPQQLFANSSHDKSFFQALMEILLAFVSVHNIIRGLFVLIISSFTTVYCIYLLLEGAKVGRKHERKDSSSSQRLMNLFTFTGHSQDIEYVSIDGNIVISVDVENIIRIWDVSLRQPIGVITRSEVNEILLQRQRDKMSRYIEGCENPPDIITTTTTQQQQQQQQQHPDTITGDKQEDLDNYSEDLPSLSSSFSGFVPDSAIPEAPPIFLPEATPVSLTTPSQAATPTTTTASTTIGSIPIPIPDKYIPNFLKKHFSVHTLLSKKSPDKRDFLARFRTVDSISEHSEPQTPPILPPLIPSLSLTTRPSPFIYSSMIPSRPHSSASSSHDSTHPSSTYNKPLLSTHEVTSSRRTSINDLTASFSYKNPQHETTSMDSQWSVENLSLLSDNVSELSYETANTAPPMSPPPVSGCGFKFKEHFSLFSQFTSNLALEMGRDKNEGRLHGNSHHHDDGNHPLPLLLPPIWSLDSLNGLIVVGCSNGHIEVWSSVSSSLHFFLSVSCGVTVIKLHSVGIICGCIDGSLHLVDPLGHVVHSVSAHSQPISHLKHINDTIITGSYDTVIKIFRLSDFICLRSLYRHTGRITSLVLVGTQFCISGCSGGLVCYWNITSGQLIHELTPPMTTPISPISIIKVTSCHPFILSLLVDNSIIIWNNDTGIISNIIELNDFIHDIEIIPPQFVAIALQSSIVIYDIISRREIIKKQLSALSHVPIVRHLCSLDHSTLICSTGCLLHLVPSDIKIKSD